MTPRPMPGPPEHVLGTRDHGGNPDECCWVCYYTHLPDHLAAPPKRLTDAECAAERGEARADWMYMKFLIASRQVVSMRARPNAPMPEPSPPLERKLNEARDRLCTWRRFATHPHALEEA